jgi:hypothetical protein
MSKFRFSIQVANLGISIRSAKRLPERSRSRNLGGVSGNLGAPSAEQVLHPTGAAILVFRSSLSLGAARRVSVALERISNAPSTDGIN